MPSHSQIESILQRHKEWYRINYPLCLFCGHMAEHGDLAHLIRKSYRIDLQTVRLNTGLAHRDCHTIFDDYPDQAVYLPRILECLYIIWTLDKSYFNQISGNFEPIADILARFPKVPKQKLTHHGELIQLTYLMENPGQLVTGETLTNQT